MNLPDPPIQHRSSTWCVNSRNGIRFYVGHSVNAIAPGEIKTDILSPIVKQLFCRKFHLVDLAMRMKLLILFFFCAVTGLNI